MKRWIIALLLAVSALCSMVSVPALAWSGRLGWTYNAHAPLSSSVAAAGGLILVGDTLGNLHAVYAASGQPAWVYKGTNSVVGLPAISGNMVVFAQADGTITALNLLKGSVIWQYLPPANSSGADTVLDGVALGDGKVFFVKENAKLYALNASNGKLLWTYNSAVELRSAPYFSDSMVFLGEQQGIFSAINPKTGKRTWGGGAGGPINTPAAGNGNVYYSSWDGSVQSVRIRGVVPQWKTNVGAPITTPPFLAPSRLLVGTGTGAVTALNRNDGTIQWTFDTEGGSLAATPIAAEGLVFVGSGKGTLFVLDEASGTARFSFPTGGGINGTPAFSAGVLFLGSADGNLYAIR